MDIISTWIEKGEGRVSQQIYCDWVTRKNTQKMLNMRYILIACD